jgi:hypothetical protein
MKLREIKSLMVKAMDGQYMADAFFGMAFRINEGSIHIEKKAINTIKFHVMAPLLR